MLVELDSLNWMYKDLYSGKEDSNLEIKSSMLLLRPKVNAIKYVNSIIITFLLYLNVITIMLLLCQESTWKSWLQLVQLC